MNKNALLGGIVMLLIGIGMGYGISSSSRQNTSHMMPKAMTDSLKDKKGEEFEIAFLEGMITHHEGAIEMAKELEGKTERPELLALSHTVVSTQNAEIETMNGWLKEWYDK